MVKVWTTLNSTMGPTSNQLKDHTLRRAKSNLSAYSAGDFVRDRLIDEEEIKRNIAAGFSDKLGKVKVVDQGSLQPVIEEIKAEETAETPPTQAELLIHVVGPRLSTMRANSRAGSRQQTAGSQYEQQDPKSLEQIQLELAQLRAELAALADKQQYQLNSGPSMPDLGSGDFNSELSKLKTLVEANTTEIKVRTDQHNKLKDSIQNVLKKVREEFDGLKTETKTQLEAMKMPAPNNSLATESVNGGQLKMLQAQIDELKSVNAKSVVSGQTSLNFSAAQSPPPSELEGLKKEVTNNKTGLAKFKDSVQNVLKKVREEFDSLKVETNSKIDALKLTGSATPLDGEQLAILQAQIDDLKSANAKIVLSQVANADVKVGASPEPTELMTIKKEVEENKASLAKFKENVQSILKKVKEEFTALDAKTTAALEGSKVQSVSQTPALQSEHKNPEPSSKELDEFKAATQAKIDEANASVTKLKDSIQGIIKKVKEEFTALDAKVSAMSAEKPVVVSVAAQSTPSIQTGVHDYSAEIAALKNAQIASEDGLKKQIAEATESVTKLKESMEDVVKQVKEDFIALESRTAIAIEPLQKERKEIQPSPVLASKTTSMTPDTDLRKIIELNNQTWHDNLEEFKKKITTDMTELHAKIHTAPVKTATPAPSNSTPVAASPGPDLVAEIKVLKTAEDELRKKLDETNSTLTKLKDTVTGAFNKVKQEFSDLDTRTTTAIETIKLKPLTGTPAPSNGTPSVAAGTPGPDYSEAILAVKAAAQARDADLQRKIEEATASFTQLKDRITGGLSKVQEEVSELQTRTKSELELLKKEQKAIVEIVPKASASSVEEYAGNLQVLQEKLANQIKHDVEEVKQSIKVESASLAMIQQSNMTSIQSDIESVKQQLKDFETQRDQMFAMIELLKKPSEKPEGDELRKSVDFVSNELSKLKETFSVVQSTPAPKAEPAHDYGKDIADLQSKLIEKQKSILNLSTAQAETTKQLETAKEAISAMQEAQRQANEQLAVSKAETKQAIEAVQKLIKPPRDFTPEINAVQAAIAKIETELTKKVEDNSSKLQSLKSELINLIKTETAAGKEETERTIGRITEELHDTRNALAEQERASLASRDDALRWSSEKLDTQTKQSKKEFEDLAAKIHTMVSELKLELHVKKLENQTQIEAIWAELNMNQHPAEKTNATPEGSEGSASIVKRFQQLAGAGKHQTLAEKLSSHEQKIQQLDNLISKIQTLEQRGDNMTSQIEEVSAEFKKHASAFNLASIMSQMTTEIKNRLNEHFKNESSAEEMIKPLEEQVSELKLTLGEHQTAIMNLTSTDDNLEKKIRGLQKKTKTELDERVGKVKAELVMLQTNFKIQEERMLAVETKQPVEPRIAAVRQTSISPEPEKGKKTTADGPYATIGDITKKIHALKKAFRALEDHALAADQTTAKEIQSILLRLKKLELMNVTMQEMVASQEGKEVLQSSSTFPAITPTKKSQQFSTDQMKRILALIENNAQSQALQRETTMNVLLRLELLEQQVKTGPMMFHQSSNRRNSDMDGTADKIYERNKSNDKFAGSESEKDLLTVMSIQKDSSAMRTAKRSINQSPLAAGDLSSRPQAFKVNDLSMYGISRARHSKHRSIVPKILQSQDTSAEEIMTSKHGKKLN